MRAMNIMNMAMMSTLMMNMKSLTTIMKPMIMIMTMIMMTTGPTTHPHRTTQSLHLHRRLRKSRPLLLLPNLHLAHLPPPGRHGRSNHHPDHPPRWRTTNATGRRDLRGGKARVGGRIAGNAGKEGLDSGERSEIIDTVQGEVLYSVLVLL